MRHTVPALSRDLRLSDASDLLRACGRGLHPSRPCHHTDSSCMHACMLHVRRARCSCPSPNGDPLRAHLLSLRCLRRDFLCRLSWPPVGVLCRPGLSLPYRARGRRLLSISLPSVPSRNSNLRFSPLSAVTTLLSGHLRFGFANLHGTVRTASAFALGPPKAPPTYFLGLLGAMPTRPGVRRAFGFLLLVRPPPSFDTAFFQFSTGTARSACWASAALPAGWPRLLVRVHK